MKKLFLSFMIVAFVISAGAQEKSQTFKPFKVDFALGYAVPSGSGSKGGVLVAFEPKYSINDNITFGLRIESAITARAYTDANGNYVSGSVKGSASYLLTGDYYIISLNKFRPFVGAGAGIYSLGSVNDVNTGNGSVVVAAGNKFGFMPRAGFEFGHFRMAVEYNAPGKTGPVNNNYLGFKIGFFAGGGRLK